MNKLRHPKSNKEEILLTMIKSGKVSIIDYPYMSGFRTRISEISKAIKLKTVMSEVNYNKHGNHYIYAIHSLENKEQAIEYYIKLTKNK